MLLGGLYRDVGASQLYHIGAANISYTEGVFHMPSGIFHKSRRDLFHCNRGYLFALPQAETAKRCDCFWECCEATPPYWRSQYFIRGAYFTGDAAGGKPRTKGDGK